MGARDRTRPAAPAARRLSRLGPLIAAALSSALPGCVEAVTVEQPPPRRRSACARAAPSRSSSCGSTRGASPRRSRSTSSRPSRGPPSKGYGRSISTSRRSSRTRCSRSWYMPPRRSRRSRRRRGTSSALEHDAGERRPQRHEPRGPARGRQRRRALDLEDPLGPHGRGRQRAAHPRPDHLAGRPGEPGQHPPEHRSGEGRRTTSTRTASTLPRRTPSSVTLYDLPSPTLPASPRSSARHRSIRRPGRREAPRPVKAASG